MRIWVAAALLTALLAQAQAAEGLRVRFPVSVADTRSPGSPPPASGTLAANWDPYMPTTPPTVLQRLMPPAAPAAAAAPAMPYYSLQPAVVPVAQAQPAGNGWVCSPSGWYGQADAIYFDRDNRARDQAVVLDGTPAPNTDNSVLRTSDVSFDPMAGGRILVGYDWDQYVAWETSYFGIYAWNDTDTVTGAGDLQLPDGLGQVVGFDFLRADVVQAQFRSALQNAELNRIRSLGPAFAWLAGFRYVYLHESYQLTSTSNITGTSLYKVNARNDLFGGQLGGRLRQTYGSLGLELVGKAGVFGNVAGEKNFVANDDGMTLRNASTTGGNVAFVGDLWLTTRMQLTQNISLESGYSVMWVEQVALALNQLDFTNTPQSGTTLNTDGGVFVHGAHAGLLAVW